MVKDIKLDGIEFIPESILTKLMNLEIHTIRQLSARLRSQGDELEDYLQLSDEEFARFSRKVDDLIKNRFPEDDLPTIHPTVNKRGVAVDRLDDSSRPRFFGHK